MPQPFPNAQTGTSATASTISLTPAIGRERESETESEREREGERERGRARGRGREGEREQPQRSICNGRQCVSQDWPGLLCSCHVALRREQKHRAAGPVLLSGCCVPYLRNIRAPCRSANVSSPSQKNSTHSLLSLFMSRLSPTLVEANRVSYAVWQRCPRRSDLSHAAMLANDLGNALFRKHPHS